MMTSKLYNRGGRALGVALPLALTLLPHLFCGLTSIAKAQTPPPATKTAPATANGKSIPPLGPARPLNLPKVVEDTLPNGLKIVLLEDHSVPALWMQLALPAGSVRDPKDKIGLASMTATMLTQGSGSHNESQIADIIDGLGASLSATAGADFLSVSAQGLSNSSDTLFSLLSEVTLNPSFPAEELDRQRTQTLNAVTASLAEPATVADAAIKRLVYGAHPYGNFTSGTPDTLTGLTRDDLAKFHDTYFAPNQATLFLVGDITPAQAHEKALAAFGNWAKKEVPPAPGPPLRRAAAAAPTKPQITIVDRPGAAQTEVRIGTLTSGYSDPKRIVGTVATAVLGLGQFEGRLTREIRVKRGLTYGAASFFDRKKDAGMFEIQTFTKNVSTGEVVKLALEEARKISAEPIPGDELMDRKTFLQGSFAVSVATPTGVLTRLVPAVLYGGGPSDLTKYSARVDAASGTEIADIMRALHLDAPRIALVGDAKAIQKDVAPLGTVKVIPADRLDLQATDLEKKADKTGQEPAPAGNSGKTGTADPEGKARLEATIKAHGGDAFLKVKSIVLKGKGELSDPTGQFPGSLPIETLTITLVSPDKVRADLAAGFPISIGTEGGDKGEWMTLAGAPQAAPGGVSSALNPVKLLRDAYTNNWPVAALPKDAGTQNEEGYAITAPGDRVINVFADPTTHVASRVVLPSKQGNVTVLMGKYRPIQGVQLPGTLKVVQNKVTYLDLTFTDMSVNLPVDSTIFAMPKK